MNEWVLMGFGLLLTVGTGLFVASEFALVNLDRHELECRRDRGERGLGPTIGALRTTSTHLSSAQLGITLTTLLTGYTFEPALSSVLEEPLEGLGLAGSAVTVTGAILGILVATLLSMVVGELAPKNFALAVPRQTAKVVVPFQVLFTAAFKPLVMALNGTANKVICSLGVEPREELSGARTAEELSFLVRRSAEAGVLEEHDATLLDRTLRFSALDAADVMTPRVQISSIPRTASAADVVSASLASGHSRLVVVDDGPDDVVGVVHVKQAWSVAPRLRGERAVTELMTEPVRVPATNGTEQLLATLRGQGLQLAVVTDEYGGTAGVVTLEDLVEEIVGELDDEFDRARQDVVVRRDGAVLFDASLRPDELVDRAGIVVPVSEHWDTVAGFVLDGLGRVPVQGDEVELPAGGRLRVERIDGRRIVRLRHLPDAPPEAPTDAPSKPPSGIGTMKRATDG